MSAMQMIQNKVDLVKSFFQLPDTQYAKLPDYLAWQSL